MLHRLFSIFPFFVIPIFSVIARIAYAILGQSRNRDACTLFWIPLEFVKRIRRMTSVLLLLASFSCLSTPAHSATGQTAIPFTLHGPVGTLFLVTGTPRIPVDVGGVTRYANYVSGDGTGSLNFIYQMQAGDVDLDGVTFGTTLDLNGGLISDQHYNLLTNLTVPTVNTSNVKVNYPSLGMDFVTDADGRYTLNGTVYNDLPSFLTATGGTFTRASIGTYYNSSGVLQTATANTPRFDHDPVTNAPKGILIEEARTNLLLRSADFENAIWGNANITVTPNTADTLAPDGTNSADKPVVSTTAATLASQTAVISGTSATYSVYVKLGSGATQANTFCLRNNTTATNLVCGTLNYSTGVFSYIVGSSGVTTQSIGNGWWRLVITATSGISAGNTLRAYSGYAGSTATAGIFYYVWGAQLEQGSFPTSYIPTTTAAVTRNADVLKMPTGSWYNTTEGSLYSQGTIADMGGLTRRYVSINDGTINESIQLANAGSTSGYMEVRDNVTAQVTQTAGSFAVGALAKIAGAYKLNDFSLTANGSAVSTDSSGTVPSPTQIDIGGHADAAVLLNGHIQKTKYYPRRISNTQLQLMTQ